MASRRLSWDKIQLTLLEIQDSIFREISYLIHLALSLYFWKKKLLRIILSLFSKIGWENLGAAAKGIFFFGHTSLVTLGIFDFKKTSPIPILIHRFFTEKKKSSELQFQTKNRDKIVHIELSTIGILGFNCTLHLLMLEAPQ